jgi:hypothetical protein
MGKMVILLPEQHMGKRNGGLTRGDNNITPRFGQPRGAADAAAAAERRKTMDDEAMTSGQT